MSLSCLFFLLFDMLRVTYIQLGIIDLQKRGARHRTSNNINENLNQHYVSLGIIVNSIALEKWEQRSTKTIKTVFSSSEF